MEIRRLTGGDERAARDIVRIFRASQVSIDRMSAFLADERNHLIAAVADERPVGYVLGYELQRIDGQGPMMFVYEIEVAEDHRRRGIGRALIEQLKRTCREGRFAKMFVLTEASNTPAMGLYASAGGQRGAPDTVSFWYPRERL
jgi:aminoglycoside 6'-N-acetyltransferase I